MIDWCDMPTRFFRAGVGTVIYTDSGEIAIFKRAQPPVGLWELQQGGIDVGELPEETLWRELHEEVGLIKDDIDLVTKMPGWTVYERSEGTNDVSNDILGQAHCWYFLKLKTGHTIDLENALEDAASEFRFATFEELIATTGEHKQHVYLRLYEFFKTNIQKIPQ
jgi:putative (di)nucleoside polyphosphate hydrolase